MTSEDCRRDMGWHSKIAFHKSAGAGILSLSESWVSSVALETLLEQVERVGPTYSTVLIEEESGTGKE
jgi:transcriptional regulator with GAF, ATPase, and Fis domain